MQLELPEIESLGAQLVAISPNLPDKSLSTVEKNHIAFEVLSDVGNHVARDFGLVFTLSEKLRPIYAFVDPDYTKRLEPSEIVKVLKNMTVEK